MWGKLREAQVWGENSLMSFFGGIFSGEVKQGQIQNRTHNGGEKLIFQSLGLER